MSSKHKVLHLILVLHTHTHTHTAGADSDTHYKLINLEDILLGEITSHEYGPFYLKVPRAGRLLERGRRMEVARG